MCKSYWQRGTTFCHETVLQRTFVNCDQYTAPGHGCTDLDYLLNFVQHISVSSGMDLSISKSITSFPYMLALSRYLYFSIQDIDLEVVLLRTKDEPVKDRDLCGVVICCWRCFLAPVGNLWRPCSWRTLRKGKAFVPCLAIWLSVWLRFAGMSQAK